MLSVNETVLILVDVQGNLARSMHDKEALFKNLQILIKGARALEIPIVWLEQNPEKLGPTIPEIAGLLDGLKPISKLCFSCADSPLFMEQLQTVKRKQVLIAGIEAHICVYQTAAALVDQGYEVQVVADAVSSQTKANRKIGLERIRNAGASLTSVETALFELLKVAEGEKFKEILKLVK